MKRNYMARVLGSIIAAGMVAGILSVIVVPNYLIMPPIGTVPPITTN